MTGPDGEQLEQIFSELHRSSRVSLALVLIGVIFLAGSILYGFTRLRPLERQISEKQEQIAQLANEEKNLRAMVEKATKEYLTLKENAERLYAVRVTPTNAVYELKATARATGRYLTPGPQYEFGIFVNSPADVLEGIKRVEYRFEHPTFQHPIQIAENPRSRFSTSYLGWGCLTRVVAKVELKDGSEHSFDFDMCRSLGPQWSTAPDQ
jgi:cell division protein FtsB